MKTRGVFLSVSAQLLLLASCYATDAKQVEKALKPLVRDKLVVVRGFPTGKELELDSSFNTAKPFEQGLWIASQMLIKKVSSHKDDLKIEGDCLPYISNGAKPTRKLIIIVHGPFVREAQETANELVERLFVVDPKVISTFPMWIANDSKAAPTDGPVGKLENGDSIYRVSPSTTPPKPVYTPDPEYSEDARKAKYQGRVVLIVVVGTDGRVSQGRLSRAIGHGLDEKAMEAVAAWKFQPATRNGQPVNCVINVEVSFNLF